MRLLLECVDYHVHTCLLKLSLDYPWVHAGWDILFAFIGESIVHGSKEVALAAIASLNPLLISQAAKVTIFPWAESSVLLLVFAFIALIVAIKYS
jgi:hypothetical protein